jgi:hypothetical protein
MILRALAAALIALGGVTACEPTSAGHPADCHSPSPYSLYDRPGHGIQGLVQIVCDTQPRTYSIHVTLEFRHGLFTAWQFVSHRLEYYEAPAGPVVGHLYEYHVRAGCQPGWWRMVVFAEGVSSDDIPQSLLRHMPRYRGMRVRHCR